MVGLLLYSIRKFKSVSVSHSLADSQGSALPHLPFNNATINAHCSLLYLYFLNTYLHNCVSIPYVEPSQTIPKHQNVIVYFICHKAFMYCV